MSNGKSLLPVAFVAALALTIAAASAKMRKPDPVNGLRLASMWCSACHAVTPVQKNALVDAPSFSSIANTPRRSSDWLMSFLMSPHGSMPTQGLGHQQIADIVAYISSLEK